MRLPALLLAATLLAVPAARAETTVTGDLPRSAELGFSVTPDGPPLVRRLAAGSPAAIAGLRDGDRLLSANGTATDKGYLAAARLQQAEGGSALVLSVQRDGKALDIRFTPPPRRLEEDPGLDIQYGVLRTRDGARLRTIVSRPKGATGPLPALFFTQWVSCGTVETVVPGREQLAALMRRSGMAVIRVERAGAGDSRGPACHELDFDTEVRHYGEALDALRAHPWVDPKRVVLYGNSLGAVVAPLVARGRDVAGVLAQGGGALTYEERMVWFDRLNLERTGVAAAEIDRRMPLHLEFHVDYLLRGLDPDRIAREKPHLAGVWKDIRGTGDGVHYGRPLAWHRQAAKAGILGAWAAIDAPVMAVYGAYDQFETRHGHALVAAQANARRPGSGTLLEIAQGDHELELYASAEDAYAYKDGQAAPELFLKPAIAWLRRVTGLETKQAG